jgi:vanillate O-demethylase monooxygenase subunit
MSMAELETQAGPNAQFAGLFTPLIRNCWYVAAFGAEIGRDMIDRRILGESVLLYRTLDGKAVALDNRCPHRSFPLSKGYLDGDNVVCGYHGLTYDPCGMCVKVPTMSHVPKKIHIRSYPLVERGPLLWIWPGAPDLADESRIPHYDDPTTPEWATASGYFHIDSSYVGLHENLLDLTHFNFLHRDLGIGNEEFLTSKLDVDVEGEQVRLSLRTLDAPAPDAFVKLLDLREGEHVDRITDFGFVSPGLCRSTALTRRLEADSDGGQRRDFQRQVLHFITPESQTSTHYFWFNMSDFGAQSPEAIEFLKTASERAFQQDKDALEWITELVADDIRHDFQEVSLPSDRGVLQMRRMLKKLADAER